jgi:hypothetical protein
MMSCMTGPAKALDLTVPSTLLARAEPPILKLDIEGDEWSVLDNASADLLLRFDQIALEFHGSERIEDPRFQR